MTERNRSRKILRAWYSVLSAYPECSQAFALSETAKRARVSVARVEQALGDDLA